MLLIHTVQVNMSVGINTLLKAYDNSFIAIFLEIFVGSGEKNENR